MVSQQSSYLVSDDTDDGTESQPLPSSCLSQSTDQTKQVKSKATPSDTRPQRIALQPDIRGPTSSLLALALLALLKTCTDQQVPQPNEPC